MQMQSILSAIQEAHDNNSSHLGLAEQRLTELPSEICRLSNLEILNLSGNRLSKLPSESRSLRGLKVLDLSHNGLKRLPTNIGLLSQLEELDLSNNSLTNLSEELCSLTHLKKLDLTSNCLGTLPREIGSLTHLRLLNASLNRLRSIPEEISSLVCLESFDLTHNKLKAIPSGISKLRKLSSLDLSNNSITDLPIELGKLQALQWLRLNMNPIRYPSPEIVAQGTESVLAFLKEQVSAGSQRVWTSKLLLVGEGGVGKTNLLRRLRGEHFVEGLETTHGIEVGSLLLPHPKQPDTAMTLKTWDFGGQEIYHATHQFFLTNRSLFLLLWNARLGFEQGKLDYWLDAIRARAPQSPVLLIATHIDEREAILPLADLKRTYPQIHGIWKVSNKTGEGFVQLRKALARVLDNPELMPLMGETWPSNWVKAAEAIRRLRGNSTTPQKALSLLECHKVTGASARTLRRWLHELGDTLDFQDDEDLKEIVILKPQWVTRHVSDVLESKDVIAGHGWFPRNVMRKLWHQFDAGLQQHFLRLMETFDLSYRTLDDEEISIVVECLSPEENKDYHQPWATAAHQWPDREITMRFKLEGNLPAGVPTWFIARTHRFTMNIHWRFGVLLKDLQEPEHLALLQAFPYQRCVELKVRGPAPHNFFTLLRDGLELTLARFPGLPVTRLIPCPGHNGKSCKHFFQFELLEKRLSLNVPRYYIECPESNEEVDVRNLLFGLTPGTQDGVLSKLDVLLAQQKEHHEDQLAEMRALSELHERQYFIKLVRLQQKMLDSPCPSVFTLRSNNQSEWLNKLSGRHLLLQIYCEEPGCWHPVGEPYPITKPAQWLEKISPHVRQLVRVLKYLPVAGRTAAECGSDFADVFKEDFEFLQALVEKLPPVEAIEKTLRTKAVEEHSFITRAEKTAVRAVAELLKGLDPSRRWGDLRPTLTPEGHCLWLCSRHAAKYDR